MAAQPKLTRGRETRLLGLLTFGESLEAACRAVQVSSTAVRKRADRDPIFAERLRVARAGHPAPVELRDWRDIAAQLEREHPLRWGPPRDPWEN
jgi:hypothetical protein